MADSGVRVRFAPIRGETPHAVLARLLYLPAILDDFTLEEDGAHTDYETVRMGEYSVPRFGDQRNMRMLRKSDLEALTLYYPAAWLHPSQQDPDWVEKKLWAILHARRPVEMLVRLHQEGWDDVIERMSVTFRTLRETIRPGQADTKYWSLSIKEWRPNDSARRGHGTSKHKLPKAHRLTATDTLESLSKHYYGSYAGWRAIAQENGLKKWGKTTHLINAKRFKVGDTIKIPRKPPIAHTNPPRRGRGGGTGGAEAP